MISFNRPGTPRHLPRYPSPSWHSVLLVRCSQVSSNNNNQKAVNLSGITLWSLEMSLVGRRRFGSVRLSTHTQHCPSISNPHSFGQRAACTLSIVYGTTDLKLIGGCLRGWSIRLYSLCPPPTTLQPPIRLPHCLCLSCAWLIVAHNWSG